MKKCQQILEQLNRPWQWYRDFFELSYLRYMATWFALVPFLANLFQQLPEEVQIPTAEQPIRITLELPFAWEVLWVASLVFLAAFVLYRWKCPEFIIRYHTFNDFMNAGHSPRWLPWEAQILLQKGYEREKFLKRLIEKKYLLPSVTSARVPEVTVEEHGTVLQLEEEGQGFSLAMPIIRNGKVNDEATSVAVREIFWELFGRYANSHKLVRNLIHILLIFSLLLVSLVVVQNIWSGIIFATS